MISGGEKCVVSIIYKRNGTMLGGDVSEPQPLIFTGDSSDFTSVILEPYGKQPEFVVSPGQSIWLACPGPGNYLNNSNRRSQEARATCIGGRQFEVESRVTEFSAITCNVLPRHEAKRTGSKCLGQHEEIQIGYQLDNRFHRIIEICRDNATFATYYSRFRLSGSIRHVQSGYPR